MRWLWIQEIHSDEHITWKWNHGPLEDDDPLETEGFPLPCHIRRSVHLYILEEVRRLGDLGMVSGTVSKVSKVPGLPERNCPSLIMALPRIRSGFSQKVGQHSSGFTKTVAFGTCQ